MSSENLNPEQKANWDHAVKEYQEIQEANVQSRFKLMSVKERQQYKQNHGCVSDQDILTHMRSLNFILGVSVSNSNSVLFTRLLNGKRPLIYAPPTSFTSPWYSVVEDNGPWEIHSEAGIFPCSGAKRRLALNPYPSMNTSLRFYDYMACCVATRPTVPADNR